MMVVQKIFTEQEVDSKVDDIIARMGVFVLNKAPDLTQINAWDDWDFRLAIITTFHLRYKTAETFKLWTVKTVAELKECIKQELRQHYRLKLDPEALQTIQKFDKICQLCPALLANIVKMSPDAEALKRNVKHILTLELPVQDLKSVTTAKELKRLVHYKLYGIKKK